MGEQTTEFRDLDHVRAWLAQFSQPHVSVSTDEATVQMVALLGQALAVIAAEVQALKSANTPPAGGL